MTAETETAAPEQDAPSGLEALAELQPQEEAVPVEPKIDDLGRAYATGRRKNAIARVWIKPGRGLVTINRRPLPVYIKTIERRHDVLDPLILVDVLGRFDVDAIVRGGGTTGQAQALKLGIARALEKHTPEFRPLLRAGALCECARIVRVPLQHKRRPRLDCGILELSVEPPL